ncbi:hypothetical protein EI42_01140 [Thermosporothrix hazakensis]|uniref:Uncharacterized protein n=1 Tax=Thermosporothrix hazakensis TaxID=644383 RepID=A0A326ULW7_THEHA|nr:hypothetical protein EI42_01140 [Thermosporothrix hazakensis]
MLILLKNRCEQLTAYASTTLGRKHADIINAPVDAGRDKARGVLCCEGKQAIFCHTDDWILRFGNKNDRCIWLSCPETTQGLSKGDMGRLTVTDEGRDSVALLQAAAGVVFHR